MPSTRAATEVSDVGTFNEQFVLSHVEAKALLSHSGLTVQDTEVALKEMDLNGDGKYQAVEVGGQIGRLMMKARDQAKIIRGLYKGIFFLGVMLTLSICANFGVSFAAVELSRKTDVKDESSASDTRNNELMAKDGHAVVKVAETVVDIKLLLTPSLPYDMLERIKTVEYLSDRKLHDVKVTGYSYSSEDKFTLHLATGGMLTLEGMAVYETKPDGSGPTELPASALVRKLVNESRRLDSEALDEIHGIMPADCSKRLAFAPQMEASEDVAAGKTDTIFTRLAGVYRKFGTECCKDCPQATAAVCDKLLDDMLVIVREMDADDWNRAVAARATQPAGNPFLAPGAAAVGNSFQPADYWTWGGMSNNFDVGTPGRGICVRAMELASPSSMGGMVEVGEGAYNSREDKHLDIEDLWHMKGDVDWVKCRKAFQDGELECPEAAIKAIAAGDDHGTKRFYG